MATLDTIGDFVTTKLAIANRSSPTTRAEVDTSFHFNSAGRRLYGLHYPARGQPNGTGVVVCNGFGKEFEIARTALSVLCRDLAERGYSCLRFDYGGYADSAGDFEDATVASMCADIEAALGELGRRSGVGRLGLIGIRLGGTLAALVAARRPDVVRLVLWEPLVRPWDTLFGALRHSVTMQTVIFGKVMFNREQIVENVLAGRPSLAGGYNFNIIDDGFPLATAFVRELQEVDLVAHPPAIKARTLVVNITRAAAPISNDLTRLAGALTRAHVPCDLKSAVVLCLPWMHEKVFARQFPALFDSTLSWIER